jgi:hypothetical protein
VAKTIEVKIPSDIEYRVLSNAFGLLISSAGLLGGEMVRMRSLDYWLDDIVPLLLIGWLGFRLYRNFLTTMMVPQAVPNASSRTTPLRSEQVAVGQIEAKPQYSADKVVEKVAQRIQAQKADALKKHTPK